MKDSKDLFFDALQLAAKARAAAVAAEEAIKRCELNLAKPAARAGTLDDLLSNRGDPLEVLPLKPAKRSGVHDRILWALVTYGPLTRAQVYYYTGVSPTSSTANTAYADLAEDGSIETLHGKISYTKQGFDKVAHLDTGPPDPYVVFEEFCKRQSAHLQKILRAHYKERLKSASLDMRPYRREYLCELAGVSLTSSSTNTAIARLGNLKIAILGRGEVTFEPWYLRAIAPSVTVFDGKTGKTRRHDAVEGKPL